MKPFEHQVTTTQFIVDNPRVVITSDPGTGKTRSVLDAFARRKKRNPNSRMLVLAPLSILEPAWGDDIRKFQPGLTFSLAFASNRKKAFDEHADIVVTNHDAVNWLKKNTPYLEEFDTLCIDEFTAFKNPNAKRSKAIASITHFFTNRIAMSGTPNTNTILDIWHPVLLVDDGKRLGRRFFSFRSQVCAPQWNGFANVWHDKPEAEASVAAAIKDINIRYRLEDCITMPEQVVTQYEVTMSKDVMEAYEELQKESVLETEQGEITAVHAGAKVKKLLQLCTGAVYNQEGEIIGVHNERYEFVIDLIKQRKCTLVAFNWKHERNKLVELADKNKLRYAVIDGSVTSKRRTEIVENLQAGQLDVVFAHPQSAGHGLTMTRATTVIWASPTYNAEHYQQFNRRIYRAGQTQRTEVIHIAAKHTWEPKVYEKLSSKLVKMEDLLGILSTLHKKRTN